MGNVVIWKPSPSALYASWLLHEIFLEAGLPKDVIQFVPGDAEVVTDTLLKRKEFAGLSFIGSTTVFKQMFGKIGQATAEGRYKNYPRVVGETSGKNFHLLHPSANAVEAAMHTVRAAFEYSGQKCSACSRAYVPKSLWPVFRETMVNETGALKIGPPEELQNFMTSVIHERAYDRVTSAISKAQDDPGVEVIYAGTHDNTEGYFIHPTIFRVDKPNHELMRQEFFGPIVSVHVYEDEAWKATYKLVDDTSSFALTGSIFSNDPYASASAQRILEHAAGNLYLNTRCTGSVVGQQPFGGSRDSGTNDKVGTRNFLMRFVSPRVVKSSGESIEKVEYPSNEVE